MDLAAVTVTSLPISLSVVGLVKGMRTLVPAIDGRFVLIAAIAVALLGGFALFAELPVLQRVLIGVLVFGQAVGGVELVDRMGDKQRAKKEAPMAPPSSPQLVMQTPPDR